MLCSGLCSEPAAKLQLALRQVRCTPKLMIVEGARDCVFVKMVGGKIKFDMIWDGGFSEVGALVAIRWY